jgi:hypothetical protein
MNIKQRARLAVRLAIKRGDLIRPSSCSRCGVTPPPAADGRSQIHGHHHDYSLPLDVEWICAKCHRIETPLPAVMGAPVFGDANGMRKFPDTFRGERSSSAKLSEADAIAILRRRGEPSMSLAKEFGVSRGAIEDIYLGRTWKHLAARPEVPHDH